MHEWLLVNLIIALAALLQAITGFGFAIMATPFLLLVMESRDCIQISIILSFFIAAVMVPKIKDNIDWLLLKRLVAGGIIGAPIGLGLFVSLPVSTVKVFVAIIVLLVAGFALLSSLKPRRDGQGTAFAPYRAWVEVIAGFASGILTVSIGMPGVPLAIYFSRGHIGKAEIRSTTLAFFIVVYIVSIILQGATGQIGRHIWLASLALVPVTLLGVLAGAKLFAKINQQRFQLLVNMILLYTGLHILVSVLL